MSGAGRADTARPLMKRQGSVSVDAAYRAMPAHHTPTEFDAKGSSGQSAWAGMMPDAAAAPPTPEHRASRWPGWSKKATWSSIPFASLFGSSPFPGHKERDTKQCRPFAQAVSSAGIGSGAAGSRDMSSR